jgi:predicted RNase H-like nuclease (RuvC/YqgF family)
MEEIKQLINKKLKDNKEEIDSLNKKLKEQLLIKKELSKQLTLESLEDVYCVNCDYEKKMSGY